MRGRLVAQAGVTAELAWMGWSKSSEWAEASFFLWNLLEAIPSCEHFCFGFVLVMAHRRPGSLQPHNTNNLHTGCAMVAAGFVNLQCRAAIG